MRRAKPADYLYAGALLAWIAAFAVESAALSRWAGALGRSLEALEGEAARLSRQASAHEAAVRRAQALSEELAFLQGLPNILPQEKGYLRTQKVVLEEVQALRRKLAPGLKGVLHILVDAKANKLYLKKGFQLLWQADCSVGRGGILVDKRTGRRWEFVTPRGEFRVMAKAENPEWKKPDWAYVESGEPVPPPEDPQRRVLGELGAYVLNLGDGILIHGTKNEAMLGRPASHGCVRLGAEDLKGLYEKALVSTKVYIFY